MLVLLPYVCVCVLTMAILIPLSCFCLFGRFCVFEFNVNRTREDVFIL